MNMPTKEDLELVKKDASEIVEGNKENVLVYDESCMPMGLAWYYKEMSKYPLLSASEEVEYALKARSGDKEAANYLYCCNWRLVVSIAKRYVSSDEEFEDTVQNGNLGLFRAVENFNPDLGYKFSTYATWWIQQSITREREITASTIRLPAHVWSVVNKIRKWENNYKKEKGTKPSEKEIKKYVKSIGSSMDTYKSFLDASAISSLNLVVGEDESTELGELIDSEGSLVDEMLIKSELKQVLLEEVNKLPKRERDILVCRFGLDNGIYKPLEEVGKKFGVTRERVRQLEAKGLRKLRWNRVLREYKGD